VKRAHGTIQRRLYDRLLANPEGRALATYAADGSYTWWSYGEVHRRAAGLTAGMRAVGLSAGEVCVLAQGSEELSALTLLGVLLGGGVPVLVAPPIIRGLHSNLVQVLSRVLAETGSRLVILGQGFEATAATLERKHPGITVVIGSERIDGAAPSDLEFAEPRPDAPAALQLTSGTTGFPRICAWEHTAVLAAVDGMAAAMGLADDDICFNWTPLYHDMGLVNNFLLAMLRRMPLVMMPTLDFVKEPARWLRGLAATGATQTWSPNFGFALAARRVRPQELEGVRLDGVRAFWNAAERIHLDTMRLFHRRFSDLGVRSEALKTNFGCAENVGGATFSDPDGEFPVERLDRRQLHEAGRADLAPAAAPESEVVSVVGVGRPYPGLEVRIVSEEGNLPDGRVGEIALATPSRMCRYLGNADATSRAITPDGLLRTGDLGYKRGEELFWVGRVHERINLQGRKYDPSDFEAVLLSIGELRAGCFAAFGIEDEELGTERLVIASEVAAPPRSPGDLVEKIRQRVATEVGVTVSDVVLLARGSMTKTSSGKRRHRLYRELYTRGELPPMAQLAPLGPRGG